MTEIAKRKLNQKSELEEDLDCCQSIQWNIMGQFLHRDQ